MAAMSMGFGFLTLPSQVYALLSTLMKLKSSRQITSLSFSILSGLSLAFCFALTKTTLDSECSRMFSTSVGESSGSIGTRMRPKAVVAKKAIVQFGMLSERMAILSSAFTPKLERVPDRLSAFSLICEYV